MLNQKGIAHIILILTLLIGIIATVFLVSKQQIFKPKATAKNIEFLENSCTRVDKDTKVLVLTCAKAKFKLISPLETDQISDAGISLVKNAYAQSTNSIGGVGYSCEKKGGDTTKIYHQQCNAVLFGVVNLCELKFIPGVHYHILQERCDIGQACKETTTDLFNTVAKCVTSEVDQPTKGFPPPIIVQPGPNKPSPIGDQLPPDQTGGTTKPPILNPTPVNPGTIPVKTPAPTATLTPPPPPAPISAVPPPPAPASITTAPNTGTGTTAPAGVGTTTPAGIGATNPPPVRTTTKYRFAEDKDKLNKLTAADWKTYTPGGVIVDDFSFSNPTPDNKPRFIFAQFLDDQDSPQLIKFSNGQDFTVAQINFPIPASNSTPTPTPIPSATATSRPTVSPSPTVTPGPTVTPTPTPTPIPTPVAKACNSNQVVGAPTCAKCNSDGTGYLENNGSWFPGSEGSTEWCACSKLYNDPGFYQQKCGGGSNTSCVGKVCSCGDQSLTPPDNRDPGHCSDCGSGGWCNGGTCASCSP